MGQHFYRRIDGYNIPYIVHSGGFITLARNQYITVTFSEGPGRIEEICLIIKQTTNEKLNQDKLKIDVDGVTIFNDYIYLMSGIYDPTASFSCPFTGYVRASTTTSLQLKVSLDFELSLVITFTNASSPDSSDYAISVSGKCGL